MPDRDKPSPIPSLMPFILMAAVLLVVFLGLLLLYPAASRPDARPECAAAGHHGCIPHR